MHSVTKFDHVATWMGASNEVRASSIAIAHECVTICSVFCVGLSLPFSRLLEMKIGIIFASVFALVLLVAFGFAESRMGLFIGRFHGLLVHFPIALLILAGFLEGYSAVCGSRTDRDPLRLILILSLVGAVAASTSGYLLSFEGGFSQNTLYWHLRLGLLVIFGTGSLLLLEWARSRWRHSKANLLFPVTLAIAIFALVITGHLGGKMAHGPDHLTEYLPRELGQILDLDQHQNRRMLNPETAMLFEDMVLPVLDQHCVECHGQTQNKGDLRLDTREGIEKGGESGPVLVSGTPDSSELIRRTLLPLNHDDLMPPEGKVPLDFGDIEIIRWWISEGAPFDRSVQTYIDSRDELPFSVRAFLDRRIVSKEKTETGVFALEVRAAAPEVIENARRQGFQIGSLAEEVGLLSVKLPPGAPFSIERAEKLVQLAPQVAWLDLSGVTLGENVLQTLSRLPHLVRLNLSRTNVADNDLSALTRLRFLEYLNLYGTNISDRGIQRLAPLRSLKKLYLWNTSVTADGVANLQRSLTEGSVNRGGEFVSEHPLSGSHTGGD